MAGAEASRRLPSSRAVVLSLYVDTGVSTLRQRRFKKFGNQGVSICPKGRSEVGLKLTLATLAAETAGLKLAIHGVAALRINTW